MYSVYVVVVRLLNMSSEILQVHVVEASCVCVCMRASPANPAAYNGDLLLVAWEAVHSVVSSMGTC